MTRRRTPTSKSPAFRKSNPNRTRPHMKPSITSLFTLEASNAGVTRPVKDPNGNVVCHITFLGVDSDVFRKARVVRNRKIAELKELKEDDRLEALEELDRELIASLVTGWDFEEPCTRENVLNLFRNAPDVFEQVNVEANKRSLFFKGSEKA